MRVAIYQKQLPWFLICGLVLSSALVAGQARAWQDSTPAAAKLDEGDPPASTDEASQEQSPPASVEVRASSFQGVTPGETTAAQVMEVLGEPQSRHTRDAEEVITYQVGPFPKVEVIVVDEAVASIVIYLDKPATPQEVAKELKLSGFQAVLIRSDSGTALGQIYPERGVMFSFDPESSNRMVGQLVLEPITAEPFLMRVRQDGDHQYEDNLKNLAIAQRYAPNTAEIHWLKAEILESKGSYRRALSAIEKAIGLAPQDSRMLITRGRIHFQLDDHEAAIADAETVIADGSTPPEYKARAKCLLADFMANGPDRQYNEALEVHQEALQMAVQLATTDRTLVRRYAKRVLVDAYFGVANDVARGKWQDKQETMLKWLKGASELAYGMMEFDQGESGLRLKIIHDTLHAYAGLKTNADAKKAISQMLDELEELLEKATDAGYQNELRWIAIETLYAAIEISRARGDNEQVIRFAAHAHKLIDQVDRQRERTPHSNYLIGQIYFYAGLAESIANQDHLKAVRHYEKALPYFSTDLPARNISEKGLHGERFVSMGVSYWQANARDEAVNLTQRGLELMVRAQREGRLEEASLAVPYGNLATMLEALDEPEKAGRMAARAEAIESR